MSTSAISQSVSKAPCGCGCSGASSSGPCTCGGASCTTCQSQTFVRPEFFAGQLLTEDDLQSLVNYVAAKNRLHARYLFGPGVVCGLKVKREPCKCGRVIVEPGYALDCCGNDIVVSCAQTLDINSMINTLMVKLRGGYDCGDQCAEQEKADASATSGVNSSGNNNNGTQSKSRPKRYCLYINYCEQGTDPVTPYSTGTTCGQSVCQTTRVQERFTFELRCPTKDCGCTPSICESLSKCQGDSQTADAIAADGRILEQIANPIGRAARLIHEGRIPEQDEPALNRAIRELETREENTRYDLTQLRDLILIARKAAAELARPMPGLQSHEVATTSIDLLSKAARIFETHADRFPTALERSYVDALADVIQKLVELLEGKEALKEIRDLGLEIRFLQWDAVIGHDLLRKSDSAMRVVREWLLDRIEQNGLPADPYLDREANFALPTDDREVRAIERTAFGTAYVAEKCLQFISDCRCNALLPPCSTCTDTGVLLACVTVKDCCVTEICNLDREFVLTGPNLRYWFPEIQELGCLIEQCCCPSCACEPRMVPDLSDEGNIQRRVCDVLFNLMQARCQPSKEGRMGTPLANAFGNLLSAVVAQTGKAEAKREFQTATGSGLSVALDEMREELKTLRIEYTKLKQRVARAGKKAKAEG